MSEQNKSVADALRKLIGDNGVVDTPDDMAPMLVDWRKRHAGKAACIVYPRSTEQVAAVLKHCNDHGIQVYPQGGNTSVCGGSVPSPTGESIILSLTKMDKILDVNPANNSMIVQAGVVLQTIQEAAAEVGKLFPLSLGAEGSCQIGGNIATNAGGTAVIRYGNTRDLVLGLEVVLPNGTIWNGLRTLRKDNSGYDLKNLFIGSEGTLGIVTGAALKLYPQPTSVITAMLGVASADDAVAEGLKLHGAFPGELVALEIISRSEFDISLRHAAGVRDPFETKPEWVVLIELSSSNRSEESLSDELMNCLAPSMDEGIISDAVIAMTQQQRNDLWRIRHSVTEANTKEGMGLTHDIGVPIYRIPDFIKQAGEVLATEYPESRPVIVGHMGDGNLHYIAMIPHATWADVQDKPAYQHKLARKLYDIAHSMGGTFSAEHGIGSLHVAEMPLYKPAVELDIMRQVKQLFDPNNIMNPGRVLPGASDAAH